MVNWQFKSGFYNNLNIPKSIPVIHNNQIMFGTDKGFFYSLDKETGDVLWSIDASCNVVKGIISSPFVYNNKVYFGSYNGSLYCVDLPSGNLDWEEKLCTWIGSSPYVIDNMLFIGLEHQSIPQGELIAFDIVNRKRIWGRSYKDLLHGSPIVSEKHNCVIIGTNDSTVDAYNYNTGDLISSLKVGGPVKYFCTMYNDYIVSGSHDGCVYISNIYNPDNFYGVRTPKPIYTTPLIYNDRLFFGSQDGNFYIIDLIKKQPIKIIQIKQPIVSSPSVIKDKIVFGDVGGVVHIIDIDGIEVDKKQFEFTIVNKIVSDDRNMFVSLNNGTIISTPITF